MNGGKWGMKTSVLLFFLALASILTIGKSSEAIEIQMSPSGFDTKEAIRKIEDFLNANPFPDSAYNVELDKQVNVKDGRLEVKFKLVRKQEFFSNFQKVIEGALGYERMNIPWVGIEVAPSQENRVRIAKIDPNSPALMAGLRKGDWIGSYKNVASFEEMVANSKPGQTVKLWVIRSGGVYVDENLDLRLTIGEKMGTKTKFDNSKEFDNRKEVNIKLSGEKYRMPREIFESLAKLLKSKSGYGAIRFPLVIRYELKDNIGNIIQKADSNLSDKYLAGYRSLDPQSMIAIDFDDDLVKDEGTSVTRFTSMEQDKMEINVDPEQIKQIVASIVTVQKEKEIKEAEIKRKAEREAQDREERLKREEERRRADEAQRLQEEAKNKRLSPKCNGVIISQQDFLLAKNTYADKGKCVDFMATTFQMSSANSGLFDIGDNQLAFIQFKQPFRGGGLKGVAKIKGMHTYTTKMGKPNQVPHFEMVEIETTY